jgi:hypothetical protein
MGGGKSQSSDLGNPCSSVGDPGIRAASATASFILAKCRRGVDGELGGLTEQGRRTEHGRRWWVLPRQQNSNADKVKSY